MTSLLQAIAQAGVDQGTTSQSAATSQAAAPPSVSIGTPASEEAIRFALQLRELRPASGARTLLFVPVSGDVDASAIVDDAVRGLLELHEGPILVMDFRPRTGETLRDAGWSVDAGDGLTTEWGTATSSTATVAQPFAARADAVQYAASGDFASRLSEARSRYAYVICIGGEVASSVETQVTAALFDGVVLSVAPGRTTRTDLQRVSAQLRRAHANLLGFVMDARPPVKRSGKG